jgi:hypothetical protein
MSIPQPISTVETRLAAIETAIKKDTSGITAWIKTNASHFVTWAGLAYAFFKHAL